MTDKELDKMIDSHWDYVGGISKRMYKDAFRHGFKHGLAEAEKQMRD